ncbi:MAG: triose-phosphate isomerase [Erysipelotrichaceae bacterium]
MYKGRKIRTPYFGVNPKSYIYGDDVVQLAIGCDKLAEKYDLDIFFTAQLVDLPLIVKKTKRLIVTAQAMDPIVPGRGMGKILPDALKRAGVMAVTLNHCENPLTVSQLSKAIEIADQMGFVTQVCANSLKDAKAIAQMEPNIIICEQDSRIASGSIAGDDYMIETTLAIKQINPAILVSQAGSVNTAEDVYNILCRGSDGTGGTSNIMLAENRIEKVEEMLQGLVKYRNERKNECLQ